MAGLAALVFAMSGSEGFAGARSCTTASMRVEGGSMAPRIAPGQMIEVVEGGPECFGQLAHGDVLLFESASSRIPLIKTLRGLPGEALEIRNGQVFVAGELVRNSAGQAYLLSEAGAAMIGLYARDYHGVIPPGTFLMLGEQPRGTLDSSRFGLISASDVIGKVKPAP